MRCEYCIYNREGQPQNETKPQYSVNDLLRFIEETEHQCQGQVGNELGARLMFYGGEPLLVAETIEDCMNHPISIPMEYVINTNGTLLHRLSASMQEKLSAMLISIDGPEHITDAHRGKGVYRKIIQNLNLLSPELLERTIARITFTIDEKSSIFESVTNLLQFFKQVYWQIQSLAYVPSQNEQEGFLKKYQADIHRLLQFWLTTMREKGYVERIIPFLAVTSSLILEKRYEKLRCACGSELVYIDLDGSCYMCGELMNHQFAIGDIWSGISFPSKDIERLKHACSPCGYRYICGGRCLSCFVRQPDAPFGFYCQATKILINEVERVVPAIENLIAQGVVKKEDFTHEIMTYTEEIC